MVANREVVITGLGLVSPLGLGSDANWNALQSQRSGVGFLTLFDSSSLPVKIAAEVSGFDPKQWVKPRKSLKVMCREIQLGVAAAAMAIQNAALDVASVESDRFGVVLGSDMFYAQLDELTTVMRNCQVDGRFDFNRWGESAMSDIFPLWMLKYLPNMAACHIGIAHDARGHNNSITVGEASSLLAVNESVEVIRRGRADVILAGGSGTRLNLTQSVFRGWENLSTRNDTPEQASRPFDADRDGMVNGEGAGVLVLETRQHAEARGAKPLARITGFGSAYGGRGDQTAQASAFTRAMQTALAQANREPHEIGHVNAHGISMLNEDRAEAQAIREVLGNTPVTAIKSYFGNLGAGGAAVELGTSILSLSNNSVPASLNYAQPDPECPVNVVHGESLTGTAPIAIKLSRSGTGQTAAAVIDSS